MWLWKVIIRGVKGWGVGLGRDLLRNCFISSGMTKVFGIMLKCFMPCMGPNKKKSEQPLKIDYLLTKL